jgi:hypothetical protein
MVTAARLAPLARAALVLAWAAGASLLTGCATTSRIYVHSTAQTNDGNTFYMMVRSADRVTAAESYQDVAQKVTADPPDPTVLSSQPIFPGNASTITLDDADKKDVVIYFFFTDPGQNWRLPLRKPLPSEVYIDLGRKQIERVQVRRR